MIFRIFFESGDLQNLCAHAVFRKGRALENQLKTRKNQCEINANFEREKKCPRTCKKMDLGGSWAQFGRGLGRSGASFGRSWAIFANFFDILNDVF